MFSAIGIFAPRNPNRSRRTWRKGGFSKQFNPLRTKLSAKPAPYDKLGFLGLLSVNQRAEQAAIQSLMKKYVMWGSYCDNVLEKRAPYRQAHLDNLQSLKAAGQVFTIGPTQDLKKVFGVYIAEDESAVRKLIESDPYWQNQIWTDYEVYEWIQAL